MLNKNILISAFGIHTGGGLVLLRSLLLAAEPRIKMILLDSRVDDLSLALKNEAVKVRRSFISRLIAQTGLALSANKHDILFSFNSLPPLVPSKAYVINYVHAPHFAGLHTRIHYPFLTQVRHFIERLWFRCGLRNCNEVWVQTDSMFNAMMQNWSGLKVRVIPIVDDLLVNATQLNTFNGNGADSRDFSFFYPADGVGHKNHSRLFQAWSILKEQGLVPNLYVTLRSDEFSMAFKTANLSADDYKNIINIGRVSRLNVVSRMKESTALIFPSLAETFGIPMLEAKMLNKPILASERDYVRDVCAPVQTFDPESSHSIAHAVSRFITGREEPNLKLYSPTEFVNYIIEVSK